MLWSHISFCRRVVMDGLSFWKRICGNVSKVEFLASRALVARHKATRGIRSIGGILGCFKRVKSLLVCTATFLAFDAFVWLAHMSIPQMALLLVMATRSERRYSISLPLILSAHQVVSSPESAA